MSYAKNIQELCNKVGISRPTYNLHKDFPTAPQKTLDVNGKNQYSIEAWVKYCEENAIETGHTRISDKDLKAKLTKEQVEIAKARKDITRIERDERKKLLIDRAEADDRMVWICQTMRQGLDNLVLNIQSVTKDDHITKEVKRLADEIAEQIAKQIEAK